MIVIVPVLLPAGLMEHLRIVAAVLLLPTIVEVRQLHVAIRRQVVVAVPLQVLLILRAVPLQAPAIHRVNLLLGRVVTQAVVEVVVPVPVQVHPVVEAVVEEDKIVVFIKRHIYEKYKIGNGDSLYFIGYCCRKCTEFI